MDCPVTGRALWACGPSAQLPGGFPPLRGRACAPDRTMRLSRPIVPLRNAHVARAASACRAKMPRVAARELAHLQAKQVAMAAGLHQPASHGALHTGSLSRCVVACASPSQPLPPKPPTPHALRHARRRAARREHALQLAPFGEVSAPEQAAALCRMVRQEHQQRMEHAVALLKGDDLPAAEEAEARLVAAEVAADRCRGAGPGLVRAEGKDSAVLGGRARAQLAQVQRRAPGGGGRSAGRGGAWASGQRGMRSRCKCALQGAGQGGFGWGAPCLSAALGPPCRALRRAHLPPSGAACSGNCQCGASRKAANR